MGNEVGKTRFVITNGKVMRRINILSERYQFIDLVSVQYVIEREGVKIHEFLDSINYLSEAGYIELRFVGSHGAARLADAEYTALEAKVSAKGIRLFGKAIRDELIPVL